MTATLRFADLDGMTVVTGPASEMTAAIANASPVTIDGQTVTLTGDVETLDDGTPVCEFTGRQRITQAGRSSRRAPRKACVTGGNCSSHGDGRSCGARDCDGYES